MKAIGFVVQDILFDIEAQAILPEGVQVGGFIADDQPALAAAVPTGRQLEGTSHRQVEWTELRFGEIHFGQESGLPRPQTKASCLWGQLSFRVDPEVLFDTDAKVPI